MTHRSQALCLLVIALLPVLPALAQSSDYGPELKSFLELMRHEEDELEFQIKHNEISRRDYIRSKDQLLIHRQKVVELLKRSGGDEVPEIHVLPISELEQLIEGGVDIIKTAKPGDIIKDKWKYLGSTRRSEVFYIFERVTPR